MVITLGTAAVLDVVADGAEVVAGATVDTDVDVVVAALRGTRDGVAPAHAVNVISNNTRGRRIKTVRRG
jgi:hypothetical protein